MRLQHIPFTLAAIQLSPKAAAGMTIRTAIAESRPALIRTVRLGAEMLRGVHLARAAPVGGARRGWDRRRRGRRFLRRRQEAEVDEMWSYVGKKREPRWLWHAIDHRSAHVLAYVLGRRKDEVFLTLKALLEPFGITRYYTDYWGAYTRHLDADEHQGGKHNTQQIERKHLTLRTRIKRLVRKTI